MNTTTNTIKIECTKCGGTGTIRAFKHIDNGRCFACQGKGFRPITRAKLDAQNRRNAKKAAEATAAFNKRDQENRKLAEKYANDPRIGPIARRRCAASYVYSSETYEWLNEIDTALRNLAE